MTIKQWLKQAEAELQEAGIGSAKIDAELILSHTIFRDRAFVLGHNDTKLPQKAQELANNLIARRKANEPIAFLLGEKEFFGLRFKTDKRALIPRGETEILVETAIDWLSKQTNDKLVAEIGTGSGAISIAIAHDQPHHHYMATDISDEAIALANENAQRLKTETIVFYPGNLASPLLPTYRGKINLLTANLPYIPSSLLVTLDPTITYFEPDIALDGGDDGLALYRLFLPQAKELLAPGGLMLLEHDYDQGEAMQNLVRSYFSDAKIKTLKDYLSDDRVLFCQT